LSTQSNRRQHDDVHPHRAVWSSLTTRPFLGRASLASSTPMIESRSSARLSTASDAVEGCPGQKPGRRANGHQDGRTWTVSKRPRRILTRTEDQGSDADTFEADQPPSSRPEGWASGYVLKDSQADVDRLQHPGRVAGERVMASAVPTASSRC